MCEYCDNLDVTGRGKNLSIRKDDLYRDFMQLICFPKTEMRKKKSYAIYANIQSVTMYANINFCPMCGCKLAEDKNTHGMMEQAGNVLDGVARLKERFAELEEERRWRKFPEEKPEEWDTVLVRLSDGFYDLAVYMSNGQGWDIGDGLYHKPEEVTHWMPLPSAPKDGE